MKTHTYIGLMIVLIHGSSGVAGTPEAARSSPHEWECTYAFSDTTCREMISAWAEDEGLDAANVTDLMRCSDCQRREVVGAYSTRYLIGYECNNRDGYDRRFASLDHVIGVYRQAENRNEGWRVTGWEFHRCLLSWRCAQACAIDFDRAICVPLSGYYVGRWLPEMGRQCDENATNRDDGDLPFDHESGSNRETRWHGLSD
ncbi:MAG: hypothetical protein CBE00_05285 [Planctomycetaceae bacterium TMED240]|nr:hypothetical protein [Rhodopirellula sp.]OUX07339.1 MAG: hypothetical protein CBE00_05285 [Planctomycetaceae bacterium TMED240]